MTKPRQSKQETIPSRRIGFLVHTDCEIVDLCGPFDAFYYANLALLKLGRTSPNYQCVVLAAKPGQVRTKCGLEIGPTHSYTEMMEGLDTLIVVGGANYEEGCKEEGLVEWVRSIAPRVRRVASVCSGAFMLAAAGLLDHRRVTTHWLYAELLGAAFPLVQVDASLIFARDGNIYTSGGITSGIDLALALVEEDLGQEIALLVARVMVVFPHRPGGQSQFSGYFTFGDMARNEIGELQGWILGHPAADLSIAALAARMEMSPRNFSRLFRNETGQTPAHFVERARADAARSRLEQTLQPIETITEACGFKNTERMRRTFQRLYDTSPADYRARFRSSLLGRQTMARAEEDVKIAI
jgi:transcriptional regulator GlxA family with amidase domain